MPDFCAVTKAGEGKGPFNESTGQYDPPARVTVYSGKCRFQTSNLLPSNTSADAGERQGTIQSTFVQLPHSEPTAADVAAGQTVEVVTCAANPALVGRKPTIVGKEPLRSQTTVHRFILNEVGS